MGEISIRRLKGSYKDGFEIVLTNVKHLNKEMEMAYDTIQNIADSLDGLTPLVGEIKEVMTNYSIIRGRSYSVKDRSLKLNLYVGKYIGGSVTIGVDIHNLEKREDKNTLEYINDTLSEIRRRFYGQK